MIKALPIISIFLFFSATALAGNANKVAVMEIDDLSHTFGKKLIGTMTDYLRVNLAKTKKFVVIDKTRQQEALRDFIKNQKKESYKECYEKTCQIPLGQALAADTMLRVQVDKVGSYYTLQAEMVDLAKEASIGGAVTKCKILPRAGLEDRLLEAIEDIIEQLTGEKTNPEPGSQDLKQAGQGSQSGSVLEQYNLGEMYYSQGNFTEAVKYYRKAADQGHPDAQFDLGWMYEFGEAVPEDSKEAVKWFRKSADQGNAEAQYMLGLSCQNGEGLPKNLNEAVKWYRKAADQGHGKAQCSLGMMYYLGEGVQKNIKEAVRWFRMAAEQDDPDAQYMLGQNYRNGEGLPKDSVEAVQWFRKSADHGNTEAQFSLGTMYSQGEGVPRDLVTAYMWINLAAGEQDEDAINARESLEEQMTQSQIAEAQKMSRAFVPK